MLKKYVGVSSVRGAALSLGALLVPLSIALGGGLPPQEGKRPCPPVLDDLHISDPVFMATERFTHEQTDLSINVPGGTLEFTRTYRSREYQPPNIGWTSPWHPLGPNWRHNFEADIKVRSHNDVTSVIVSDGSGRVDLYDRKLPFTGIPPTCPPSKREYYSSPGRDNVIELTYDRIDCTCVDPNRTGSVPVHADWQSIVEVIDPPPQPWPPETFGPCMGEVWSLSSIRIIRPDHSETRFELFVRSEYPFAGWRPVETTTADGTWLTYSYDACSRLAMVSSGSGHWIRLHYAPDSPPPPNPPAVCADRLVAIEDNAGRWVHYGYWGANEAGGNNGDLREAVEVGLPGDSPRTWSYTYQAHGANGEQTGDSLLLSITDPRGHVLVSNTYDPDHHDQVSKQIRYGSGRYDYTYWLSAEPPDEDGYTSTSINRDGQLRVMTFVDPHGVGGPRMRSMREFAGRIPASSRDSCFAAACLTNATRTAPGGGPAPSRVTTYTYTDEEDSNDTGYDDDVRIRHIAFPDGSSETRWYNFDRQGVGNTPFPQGFPLNGVLRKFWVGLLWKVERTGVPAAPGQTAPATSETFEYDFGAGGTGGACACSPGSPSRVLDALNRETRFEYSGTRVRKITHPEVKLPGTNAWIHPVEEFTYEQGRLIGHKHPPVDGVVREDQFLHDLAPLPNAPAASVHRTEVRLGVADAQAQSITHIEYNAIGDITRTVDARGADTIYEYNGFREVVRAASRPGPSGERINTWLMYDRMGNLVRSDTENRDQTGVLSLQNPHFTTIREYDTMSRLVRVSMEAADTDVPPNVTVLAGVPDPTKFAVTEYAYHIEDMPAEIRGPAVTSGLQPTGAVRMEYDEWNQLYRLHRGTGPTASITQFDYDGTGQLIRTIEGAGGAAVAPRTTEFIGDGLGRVVRIRQPNGATVDQAFDAVGNLKSRVVSGQLLSGTGPNVELARGEFEYDAMDRPIQAGWRLFDPAQGAGPATPLVSTAYEYHPDSSVASLTDATGQKTTFEYDGLRRPRRQTDPLGNTAELTYDINGNLAARVTREISTLDPTNPAAVRTTRVEFSHDALDRLTQVRRYTGTTNYSLSAHSYDSRGNLVESLDPRSKRTRFVYDPLSRLTQTRRSLDGSGEIVTGQTWDISSRLIAQTDDNGNTTRYAYDDHNRLFAVRFADGMIQQVGEGATWPDSAPAPTGIGTSGFDTLDNALVFSTGGPGARIRVTNTPDIMGWVTARDITYLDDAGRTATERFTYDSLGRVRGAWTRDDGLNARSLFTRTYDSLARVMSESTDFNPPDYPDSNPAAASTVAYTYNEAGQTTQVAYPGGRVVNWTHDALNRVAAILDMVPQTGGGVQPRLLAQFDYAGPSRLIRRTNGNATISRWAYNGLLAPDFTTLPSGDPDATAPGDFGFGRTTRVSHAAAPTVNVPNPAPFDEWTLAWDPSNNKTARAQTGTIGSGGNFAPAVAAYAYDAVNRLVSAAVTVPGPQGSKDPRWRDVETYALDGVHNRVAVTGGSSPGEYAFGAVDSPSRRLNQYISSPLSQYTHDQRGNTRAESAHCRGDIAPPNPDGTFGDHQVNTADMARLLGQFGQPVVTGPGGNAECDINNDGQINTQDLMPLLGNFGAGCDWTEYRYDWADRLVEVRASSWANGQGSSNGPARVEVHTYQYDALSRRIARTQNAPGSIGAGLPPPRCTHFIHGGVGSAADAATGWQVLEERDGGPNGGRTLATFVPSGRYIDEVVCFQRDLAGSGLIDNQTNTQPEPVCGPPASAAAVERRDFWLHADDLFSTTSVTDASGEVVERFDYHDYGFPLILDPDGQPAGVNAQGLYASKVGNPYLFTGREWDAESKLYHYRTRAYHPGLGRFMQLDRIGVWGDVAQFGNGFAGLAGNPGRWGDPFGLNCDGGNKDTAPPGVPPQYRDPIYKDLWPDLDRNNPANDFPLFNDEEMRRQLEFYDKEWKDALKRYEESGLKLAVEIGVIVVMTVTPLDEAAFIGWAAARGCIVVRNAAGAIIGFARGARIASKVGDDLVAAAQRAADIIGPGKGAERGKAIHSEFKKIVDSLEIPGVSTEQSFIDGRAARHGLKDSIRVDVIQRDSANNVVAVFDLKTGGASLSNQRSQQIRSHLPGGGQNIPVIEIHVP